MQAPSSSGITRPRAFAAPVEVGTRLTAARARPAQVLVRPVEQVLVGGVGVHRGHQAMTDADGLVQDLRDRREAVGRAGRVRDDVVRVGVVDLVEVHAEHEVRVRRLGALERGGDDHLRAPASRCLAAAARVRKRPVDSITTSTPSRSQGRALGSALGEHADLDVRPRTASPLRPPRREPAVDGVVAEAAPRAWSASATSLTATISIVGSALVRGPQESAADAAESVDGDADCHGSPRVGRRSWLEVDPFRRRWLPHPSCTTTSHPGFPAFGWRPPIAQRGPMQASATRAPRSGSTLVQ